MADRGDPYRRSHSSFSRTPPEFPEEIDWDLSPYTFERQDSIYSTNSRELFTPISLQLSSDAASENATARETPSTHASQSGTENDIILSVPPISYRNLFPGADNSDTDSDSESDSDSDEDDLLLLESDSVRDDRTMFGRALTVATVTQSQSIMFEENKEQAANGAKILDEVTQVPLSEFWHKITQVCVS